MVSVEKSMENSVEAATMVCVENSVSMCSPLHKVSHSSPARTQSPKRVLATTWREGTEVQETRRASSEGDLQHGEVYFTHHEIIDKLGCGLALAELGLPKAVLVSEALTLLGNEMDLHFGSLSEMVEYRSDVAIIMDTVRSFQYTGTFSRFAHAVYKGCLHDGDVYRAIVRSGICVFWDVLGAVAKDRPDNNALNLMADAQGEAECEVLEAWSKSFLLCEEWHSMSHPFTFLCGAIDLADAALEVLKFLVAEGEEEKYTELSKVLLAAIPIGAEKIAKRKIQFMEAKAREKAKDDVARMRMPRRKLKLLAYQAQ